MCAKHNSSMGLRYLAQVVMESWNACPRAAGMRSIQIALQPYLVYNKLTSTLEAIESREEGYDPQLQQTYYADRDVFLDSTGDRPVAQEALDCNDAINEALCYITSTISSTLHTLVEKSQLYTLKDEELSNWLEVTECQLETGMLPVVLQEMILSVMDVL